MKRRFFRAVAIVAGVLPVFASAIDLTPRSRVKDLEGTKIAVLSFADGPDTITWQPPLGWSVSGGGNFLMLRCGDLPEADFSITVRPRVAAAPPLSALKPEELQALAASALPRSAQDISGTAIREGSFTIGLNPSREVLCAFTLMGQKYLASVALVDADDKERMFVIITARPADFERVHGEAIASLFSWQQGSAR